MKKRTGLFFTVLLLLFLAGCSATTITEREGNYMYGKNEDINILDIDTRNHIGTLRMTDVVVLSDTPFTISEKIGTDDIGNSIYEDISYAQLVQIFYQYDNRGTDKNISSSNFTAYDAAGRTGEINPEVQQTGTYREGSKSFLVALKTKSDFVRVDFQYNFMQTTTTAKIHLQIAGDSVTSEETTAATTEAATTPTTDREPDKVQTDSKADGERETGEDLTNPETKKAPKTAENGSNETEIIILYSIIGILASAAIVLSILLGVRSRRK